MITVKGVTAGYDKTVILKDINFEINDNENLCIIGPNGCGKTTLLRAISGVLPFEGEILLDGISINNIKRKHLAKKIAMVSQITNVYFNYTVYDTVMMGRYVHGSGSIFKTTSKKDREVVEAVLRVVGMLEHKDCEIDALSGGQLQRVFLAKVLAQDPDIILLDEPTNHLDLSYQVELIKFLREWSKQKDKSVIGVLHDINLAMMLSDNLLLMKGGSVKAYGKSEDIISSSVINDAYNMDVAEFMRSSLAKWQNI